MFGPTTAMVPVLPPGAAVTSLPPLFPAFTPPMDTLFDGTPAPGAPELIGIAGRLPDDAEILVRTPESGTVALKIGESTLGWTVVEVSLNGVLFEKDGLRSLVALEVNR